MKYASDAVLADLESLSETKPTKEGWHLRDSEGVVLLLDGNDVCLGSLGPTPRVGYENLIVDLLNHSEELIAASKELNRLQLLKELNGGRP